MLAIAATASCAAASVGAALVACSETSSTTGVPPITGVSVRAESVTSGRGCGTGPTQVFKYAVVVGEPGAAPFVGGVYDCFTDATFVNLKDIAADTYALQVFAYNAATWELASAPVAGALPAVGDPNVTALRGTNPTWTTTCTATQYLDIQAVARCEPLAAGLGGLVGDAGVALTEITMPVEAFRLPNGATARCGTATDAGTDADADAGEDAADAADAGEDADASDAGADADAGPPADVNFTFARIRYRRGNQLGTTVDVTCGAGATYTAVVPSEPADYLVDVGLADGTAVVGQTTCTVSAVPGTKTVATCP